MDTTDLAKRIFDSIRIYLERNLQPIYARLRAVESRPVARDGRDGKDGKDGEDGGIGEQGPPGERGEKGDTGEQGLRGEQGTPGKDGQDVAPIAAAEAAKAATEAVLQSDVDPTDFRLFNIFWTKFREQVGNEVAELAYKNAVKYVDEKITSLPHGEKGDKGDAGEPGLPGQSVDLDELHDTVLALIAAIPKAKDGAPGKDAPPVDTEEVASLVQRLVLPPLSGAIDARIDEVVKALPKPKDGARGDPGVAGEKGERGEPGKDGAVGERGEKGEAGIQGEQGSIGAKGDKGEQGEQGIQGGRGEKGDPGADGRNGEAGRQGERGEAGERGEPGSAGRDGEAGAQGEKGEQGQVGERGERGDPGEQGIKGDVGRPGQDGLSAFQLAAKHGFVGTEAQWVASLKGKDGFGAQGEPGTKGRDGNPGRDGKDAHVDVSSVVEMVLAKVPKPKDGERGDPGRDGRSADDPAVIAAAVKLVLAQATEKVLEGLELTVNSVGTGRDFVIRLGTEEHFKEYPWHIPVPLYRDVWKEGRTYEEGDMVSVGGSMWYCKAEKSVQRPEAKHNGTAGDWVLCVKRGSDGKDADRGPPPTPTKPTLRLR